MNIKIYFLFIPLILIFFNGFSSNKRCDVKKYYYFINLAELNIIDSNYIDAKNNYKIAFNNKYPNGKDLYNAFLVDYYLKDTLGTKEYINKLAKSGMQKNYFADSISDEMYYKLIFKDYDSIYSLGYQNRNVEGINFWDSILIKDQIIRNENINPFDMKKADTEIKFSVLKFLKENDVSFEKIGFWTQNSSPDNQLYPLFLQCWHNKLEDDELDDVYLKLCLKGDLNIIDLLAVYFGGSIYNINPQNTNKYLLNIWNFDSLSSDKINSINELRKSIFIENLIDYKKKFYYQLKHQPRFSPIERNMFIFFNPFQIPDETLLGSKMYK
jgi:hypothetical protein